MACSWLSRCPRPGLSLHAKGEDCLELLVTEAVAYKNSDGSTQRYSASAGFGASLSFLGYGLTSGSLCVSVPSVCAAWPSAFASASSLFVLFSSLLLIL